MLLCTALSWLPRNTHNTATSIKLFGHDSMYMINKALDGSEVSAGRMSMNKQINGSEQSVSLGRSAFKDDVLSTYTPRY